MHVEKWSRKTKAGKETITCMIKEARMKRAGYFRIIQSIHRAKSDTMGSMALSCPMIRDIQDAINKRVRVSRDFGFQRED